MINSVYVKFYHRQKECTMTESRLWLLGLGGYGGNTTKDSFVGVENAPYFVYNDGYYGYNQKGSK